MAAPTTILQANTGPKPIAASGESNGLLVNIPASTPNSQLTFGISGPAGSTVLAIRAQPIGCTDFYPVPVNNLTTNVIAATSAAISVSDNTNVALQLSCQGFQAVEIWAVSGTLTSLEVEAGITQVSGNAPIVVANNTTISSATTFSGAVTVTSTSATALAVGANGTTNPTFVVDDSTASDATGVKVKGAAAAAGVALSVISSGTNEALTVDAKGSGVISLGTTSTGTIYMSRGSLVPPVVGTGITSLGTAQNTTPTTAQLLGGVITQTSATGAGTCTLPTGTTISGAMPLGSAAVGDSFECLYANLGGGQTVTITGQTGSTVIGTAAVPSGKVAKMKFVNTGSNTWNVYVTLSA